MSSVRVPLAREAARGAAEHRKVRANADSGSSFSASEESGKGESVRRSGSLQKGFVVWGVERLPEEKKRVP